MSLNAPDGVALGLSWSNNHEMPYSIKNTKILNNEFINCNDGIQLVRRNKPSDGKYISANYEGTIINGNDIYITNVIYTNGKGLLDQNGSYAYAENAIDIKAGSDNMENPILITNNHLWGYRFSDKTTGARNDHGSAIVIHYGVKNLNITNNIIFDSAQAIVAGDSNIFGFSLKDSNISNNILSNCGSYEKTHDTYAAVMLYDTQNINFNNNIIINSRINWIHVAGVKTHNLKIEDNTIIKSQIAYNEAPSQTLFDNNKYYDTNTDGYMITGINDSFLKTIKIQTIKFIPNRFTNNSPVFHYLSVDK